MFVLFTELKVYTTKKGFICSPALSEDIPPYDSLSVDSIDEAKTKCNGRDDCVAFQESRQSYILCKAVYKWGKDTVYIKGAGKYI